MKKVCILGGSGFVGSRLIEQLASKVDLLNVDKNQSVFYPEITSIANVLDLDALVKVLKDIDLVVLLAAEHRDDVSPTSMYYDVNVQGMKNTLEAMSQNGIKNLIFTSSVAVYGLNKVNPDESHPVDPFNHYGKSKWQAEQVLQAWYLQHIDWNINILRPTVIFGERNRGNVYNLLKQIASGKFLMIGSGQNQKSMAYVGNIVSFIDYLIHSSVVGYEVYNYVDKPDFTMNQLVKHVGQVLCGKIPTVHVPYIFGLCGGYCFDIFAFILRKKTSVSSVRVKKFCATTQFDASKVASTAFKAPYALSEGLARTLRFEFVDNASKGIVFESE